MRHALEGVRVAHVGLLVDAYDGLLDDACGAHEKPTPPVRDARLRDVDKGFLEGLERASSTACAASRLSERTQSGVFACSVS